MACELSVGCPYFNSTTGMPPATSAMFKARYCRSHNHECARYAVYVRLGRQSIPDDLPPNERLRALTIIRAPHAHAS
ncbi:MAG: hypothetical protein U1E26_09595 [Coriobacteriia bacterium]|nr:hypothetical protein [Coriobacteriia bacterium]